MFRLSGGIGHQLFSIKMNSATGFFSEICLLYTHDCTVCWHGDLRKLPLTNELISFSTCLLILMNEWIFVLNFCFIWLYPPLETTYALGGCFAAASLLWIYSRIVGNSSQKFPDHTRAALQQPHFRVLTNELIFVQHFAAFQQLFLEAI